MGAEIAPLLDHHHDADFNPIVERLRFGDTEFVKCRFNFRVQFIQTIKNFLKNFTRKTDVFHVILGRRRGGSIAAGANRGRNRFSPAILEQEIP